MSVSSDDKAEEALREYLKAVKEYEILLDKYFPVRPVQPGKPIVTGEPIIQQAMKEIEEAETRLSETRKKWDRLLGI